MPRLAPTVVTLTMTAAEKANLILQPGRLPRINDPPSFLLRGVSRQKTKQNKKNSLETLPTLERWTRTVYISRPVCDRTKPAVASQKERRWPRHKRPDHRVSFVLFKPARAVEDEGMFVLGYLCVSTCVCVYRVCALRTTSSSESSRPWMLLLSRTACWCLLPLVWLNRCTSEVICKHKHGGQRSRLWTQWRKRQDRVNRDPRDGGETIHYKGFLRGGDKKSRRLELKAQTGRRRCMCRCV